MLTYLIEELRIHNESIDDLEERLKLEDNHDDYQEDELDEYLDELIDGWNISVE